MSLPESVSAHIGVIVFGLLCDVMIITGVYSKVRFSTNINLALANCKGVISFVRIGLLILHLIIAQVRFRFNTVRHLDIYLTSNVVLQTNSCVPDLQMTVYRLMLTFYITIHTWLYLVLSLSHYILRSGHI